MHLSHVEKAGMIGIFLVVASLPMSYVLMAVRALRNSHLEMTARGVPVSIMRSEEPKRFAVSIWGLVIFMALLSATCCVFAILVLLSR